MKCVVDRAALLDGLTATAMIAAGRTPRPILQCVKLTAAKDALTLTAYDQEVGLRYHVRQVDTSKTGETLVPNDRLLAIVRESSDETMSLESKDDLLHVRGADSHFQVIGQGVKEFPPVPDLEGQADFAVEVRALREAVEQTLFAAARENTRYAINGVLWERRDKQLRLVATDGRRLAMSMVSLEKSVCGDVQQCIVPTKPLQLLSRLHFGPDEVLEAKLTANQMVLRSERATVASVLVEGHFPKYEDVIPRDNDKKIEMTTADFYSAVKRASLMSGVDSKGIRIAFGSDGVILSGRAQEQGEATVKLSGVEYGGPALTIGFNPEFLLDALKVCGEKIVFELKEPTRPGIVRSGPVFLYVVMPVNLS